MEVARQSVATQLTTRSCPQLGSRTRLAGGQRRGRASGLRCSASLSAPLEAVVTVAETVEKTLPTVSKAVTTTSSELLSATASSREETVRSFKPIFDAFAKFATRQASEPAVQSAVKQLNGAVADSLKDASSALKPAAAAASPDLLVAAAAAVGVVVVGRLALGALAGRRYRADLRAPEALDAILLGGATLVDIRSAADVSAKGNPTLPGSRQAKRVPFEDDLGSGKGKLRNSGDVQVGRLVLKIKSLQGLSRGTQIILLDSQGRDAPAVANELAAAGFSNVSVIEGGFASWLNCKLPSKANFQVVGTDAGFFPSPVASRRAPAQVTVEVVASAPPPRALPPPPPARAASRTVTVTAKPAPQRALPAPKKAGSTVVVAGSKGSVVAAKKTGTTNVAKKSGTAVIGKKK